ncbi:MAG: hypothetical protein HC769_02985 [Cyanobacteria bacterium CRU_2_1]|nr:hypothetical protein [Cyanobacteria bacterium RU_5_0]NJR57901.1 hypothetical protein [Cyanobacteria bacterium CRU_2_1]
MDPVSLIAIFAAAFVVKLGEKAVDVLGERAVESGGNLLSVLQQQDPDAVVTIERIAQRSDLTEQNFVDAEVLELTDRLRQLASTNPEVKTAINTASTAVQQQPSAIVIMSKLAEKIGVVNLGEVREQHNTINL